MGERLQKAIERGLTFHNPGQELETLMASAQLIVELRELLMEQADMAQAKAEQDKLNSERAGLASGKSPSSSRKPSVRRASAMKLKGHDVGEELPDAPDVDDEFSEPSLFSPSFARN